MTPASAPQPLLLLRRYQVALSGSKTPTVLTPSPSQSPRTASQPLPPYWKGVTVAAPALVLLRRYQVALAASNTPRPGTSAGTRRSSSTSRVGKHRANGERRNHLRSSV